MKLFLTLFLTAGIFFSCTAGVTKSLITFTTPGPDVYADGSTVGDGERYWLIFVPTGSDWALSNTGELTGALFAAESKARNGRCETLGVMVPLGDPAYTNGAFRVLLLDTRDATGKPGSPYIYAYGTAGETPGISAGTISFRSTAVPAEFVAGGNSPTLPADFTPPRITAFKLEAGNIVLKAQAEEGARYAVAASETLTGKWETLTPPLHAQTLSAAPLLLPSQSTEKRHRFFKIIRGE